MTANERQPLLDREPPLDGLALPGNPVQVKTGSERHLGPSEISKGTRVGILAGIWVAMFLASVNTTMVATLISSISSEYNRSNQASWLGTSFLLATCTFTPLYGRLCNVLGRRGANQTAVLFAAVGTLACGLSNSLEMLIAARFLSGMGSGGIFTTASIITSDMYTIRERSMTQGIASLFNGAGMGLGGPLGGWISDRYGWRWAFLIQIPLFAVSFFLTSANLHYVTPGRGRGAKEILKRIDYGGCAAMFVSVGALLFFFSFKYNQEYAWDSAPVVTSLVIVVVAAIAFLFIELKLAYEPMLAPSLLKESVPVIVGYSNALVSMCNFAIMYFFPMWFETVQLRSAGVAGGHLLPNSVAMSLGALFAGWYMAKTGRYKILTNLFGLFPCFASLLIYRLRENSSEFEQWFSIIPLGFGNAVVLQTTLICLLASIDNSQLAVGTGFTQLYRGVGQVLGVAVSSAFFQSVLDRELRSRITGEDANEWVLRIRHSSKLVVSLEPHLQRAARDSYGEALRYVFLYAAACSLISFILRLWLPELSLDDPSETPAPPSPATSNLSNESAIDDVEDTLPAIRPTLRIRVRRLSTLESDDGFDPEGDGLATSPRRKPRLATSV
ncbi:Vacuolar membrane amino acid uptake transporter fnx2 OS=Schizosaccharomyces pombe (strain 972 / ATCC 24843) GN=fnx2 PE=3 SV=1 [Rhizoctonia solani AG-1 IB]|uniref:Vacuolar membrane amino acid uptake transporter fnx2 n=1 Tax=Thanatephorus cucumeris (strain AG1-IB / isolate 7/3/14) TaxID=1108050 RepID=A0A0B7FUZ7_THACB|nr:Vacuolar membrane amino acid uptake transporter fnx2 OS=Schizosaccharomyces pombe (strain 972 / ATCC 24843) GN=fnx2 PE=3 SV=1 [Rhizoctonia solani AG-1 IB]